MFESALSQLHFAFWGRSFLLLRYTLELMQKRFPRLHVWNRLQNISRSELLVEEMGPPCVAVGAQPPAVGKQLRHGAQARIFCCLIIAFAPPCEKVVEAVNAARFKIVKRKSDAAFIQFAGTKNGNDRTVVECQKRKDLGMFGNIVSGFVFGVAVPGGEIIVFADRFFQKIGLLSIFCDIFGRAEILLQIGELAQAEQIDQIERATFTVTAFRRNSGFPIVQPIDEVPAWRMKQAVRSDRRSEIAGGFAGSGEQCANQRVVAPQFGEVMEHLDVERRKRRNVKFVEFTRFGAVLGVFLGWIAAGKHSGRILPLG